MPFNLEPQRQEARSGRYSKSSVYTISTLNIKSMHHTGAYKQYKQDGMHQWDSSDATARIMQMLCK